ncbi:MAG: sigma-70 family RNA polymerase sigma factor [Deltaproteobacteria bacterium]|nr:sigma-70 family RNA polymerase sigma factor [Deltaproteobacteria bacterium]
MSEPFAALLVTGRRREAAQWLVDSMAADVLGFCRAMVRDGATAEDLAQDTFHRAFTALDGYRGDASARTWLLAIARNRCLDHLRRQGRSPYALEPVEDDAAIDPQPLAPDLLARRADVERALASLDEAGRALVVLRFRHGMGYPELADAFGVGQGAIRMRISRALSRMRSVLEPPPVPRAAPAAPMPRAAPPPPAAPRAAAPAPSSGGAGAPDASRTRAGGVRRRAAPPPPPGGGRSFGDALASAFGVPSSGFLDRLATLAREV